MDRKDRRLRRKYRRTLKEGRIVTVIHEVEFKLTEFKAVVYRVGKTRGRVQAIMRSPEDSNEIIRSWYNLTPDVTKMQGFTLTQHFVSLKVPFTNWRFYLYPDNEYFERGISDGYLELDDKLRERGL